MKKGARKFLFITLLLLASVLTLMQLEPKFTGNVIVGDGSVQNSSIVVNLSSPQNSYSTENSSNTFNCSADSTNNLSQVTLYIWDSDSNETFSQSELIFSNNSSGEFIYNFTSNGTYSWNCEFTDVANISNRSSSNFSFIYSPLSNVTLVSPKNGYSETGNTSITFIYELNDSFNVTSCSLILNDTILLRNEKIISNYTNDTNETVFYENISKNFTKTIAPGTYTWKVECENNDTSEMQSSKKRSFTLAQEVIVIEEDENSSTTTSSSSSGTETTVVKPKIYTVSETQMQAGTLRSIKALDVVNFNARGESHSFTIDSISTDTITFTVQSNPQTFTTGINETKKIDLNNDSTYDLEVTLKLVLGAIVNVNLQEINEEIPQTSAQVESLAVQKTSPKNETPKVEKGITGKAVEITQKSSWVKGAILTIFLLIVVSVIFFGYEIGYKKNDKLKQFMKETFNMDNFKSAFRKKDKELDLNLD